MKKLRLFESLAIALCAMVTSAPLHAITPDRDWPSVEVVPALNVPMRDTAITRGPDGTYYLTGTLPGKNSSGELDYENGRQIKLWRSRDLKAWEPMGCVMALKDQPYELYGPYPRCMNTLPHCGGAAMFRDSKGRYWSTFFGNDSTSPWFERMGIIPLKVEKRGSQYLVDIADEWPVD